MKLAGGIILVIAGVIWTLQGSNVSFAPQSFMTGQTLWVVLGLVAVAAGGLLIWSAIRTQD